MEEDLLEVRCAGCGDTLEVERGLTEFACPGCATPQALPPELMPPRPRPRRALPLGPARRPGPSTPAPARVPCDGCGAVLAVPRGIRRVACPLCGDELDVAGSSARLAADSGVQVVSQSGAVAVAATSSRLLEEEPISQAIIVGQVQVGRYNKPIHLKQTGCPFSAYSGREEPSCSHRSNARTAIHVDWAKTAHTSQSVHVEESHINLLDETVDGNGFRKQFRPSAGHSSISINKVRIEHPKKVIHAPRAQDVSSNQLVHTEEVYGENQSGTTGRVGIQKARHVSISSIPEQEGENRSGTTGRVGNQKARHAAISSTPEEEGENQSGTIGRVGIQKARHAGISSIPEQEIVEPPGQIACEEQVEVDSCDDRTGWNRKRKRSSRTTTGNHKVKNGGLSSSNEEIHLTCSNNTQPESARIRNPIRQPDPASDENPFDPADIDRIVTRLCPSSLPRKQVSQARSNALENTDATLSLISINHDTPQGYRQYRAVAAGSLANQGLSSAQEHEIPEESSTGIGPHNNSSQQVRQNPSPGVMHRQHIQEDPSDDSDSQHAQVESHHSRIVRHHKNTGKGSTKWSSEEAREQPHNTHQQATLVTVCSNRPTALLQLRTATPTVVTRPPVQQQPPEHQLSDTLHSQAAQNACIGSINKSSKKRRGRGPTKLIEPRREADRPVLTPYNSDTWDIDPPCRKVASTISALLKQWHPGSTFVPANQQTNEVYQEQLILHWNHYHPDTRATILDEFLQRYKWAPGQEAVCLKLFDRKVGRQFTSLLCDEKRRARRRLERKAKLALDAVNARSKQSKLDEEDAGEELKHRCRDPAVVGHEDDDPLQWKPVPPEWMQPKWWEMLCEHWASEEVLQVSAQKRKIRYTGGSAKHTAGARTIAMHRKLMIIENGGKPVSDIEVFNRTHKRDGGMGEFVTERAKEIVERFKCRLEEAGNTEVDPHLVWVQVGGRKGGRYYGLNGIIDKARIKAMAKATPGCLDKRTRKEMFTQDQVQDMITQAMQQLNETWEKRFQSLEQKMAHGTVSPEGPKHAPSPCTAIPAAEGSASHQDASGSSDEGTYQSATDDDDDEDYVDS